MAEPRQLLPEPLSEREQEIVALIAGGLSNQRIADRLHLTRDTVKWYTRQIYQKLGVHSRAQAVAAAHTLREPQGAVEALFAGKLCISLCFGDLSPGGALCLDVSHRRALTVEDGTISGHSWRAGKNSVPVRLVRFGEPQ
jgi:DNA-binding CsgD family transcriptional regulator